MGEDLSEARDGGFDPQPVVTRRPQGHRVVRALEAPDSGAAFVELAKRYLEPSPWAVDTPTGFWWVPYRLKHTIEILEDRERDRQLCRSSFVLVEGIDPDAGVDLANYLNQRPFGATIWCDFETESLHATVNGHLDVLAGGHGWSSLVAIGSPRGQVVVSPPVVRWVSR